jgi:uncharacterized protein YacL
MNTETILLLINTGLLATLLVRMQQLNKQPDAKATVFHAGESPVVLDTCALIDGRLLDVVKANFLHGPFIIPSYVLAELQQLADSNDQQRRERARYGLDVALKLQELPVMIRIEEAEASTVPVDERLIALAKEKGARLYTTDFNLNKRASVEGVVVLNVNEIAGALRGIVLPGEKVTVKILQAGSNDRQGVGYLEDGTMVVVEEAHKLVGKKLDVVITRAHQSNAGRMVFARKISPTKPPLPFKKNK